jgi:hypothetical protein
LSFVRPRGFWRRRTSAPDARSNPHRPDADAVVRERRADHEPRSERHGGPEQILGRGGVRDGVDDRARLAVEEIGGAGG